MNNLFYNNKKKALSELLEVINKGIELLTSDYLDKNLYDTFEKYAVSTIKIVDTIFATNYASCFTYNSLTPAWSSNYGCNPCLNSPSINSASALNRTYRDFSEYKQKLKHTLQTLITIATTLIQDV